MSRPFIEFVQAQALPWERGRYGDPLSGVDARTLSVDPETGAASVLLRYPPGWRCDAPWRIAADEELFVLSGSLRIGAVTHRRYGYAHLPAGYLRESGASDTGAVVLTFFSAEPAPGAGEPDPARLVESLDALDGPWGGNFHPQFPPGAGRKFLRQDPHDGEQSWILGTMPLRSGRRPERHPVVEEMYLLAGELVGHVGIMRPGAYFWRPPEEWHGPFGSLTGNLMLFRTKGGPLSTEYTEHEVDFTWTPRHQPILPEPLREHGGANWASTPSPY